MEIKTSNQIDSENFKQIDKHGTDENKFSKKKWVTIDDMRDLVRGVIWKIAQDEGGHILHYNEWVDDNWDKLLNSQSNENKKEGK